MAVVKFNYKPTGVCSSNFDFELDGDIIQSLTIQGGCAGNLTGISRLVRGKTIQEVIDAFKGVRCGSKATSCPDQIATALSKHFQ